MTDYFQQNGQGADGSMSSGYFAGKGINLISVNAPMNNVSTPAPLNVQPPTKTI